jgi:hypothetical protein
MEKKSEAGKLASSHTLALAFSFEARPTTRAPIFANEGFGLR